MEEKSKLNTILLVIIIILLATGLGFYLFKNIKEEEGDDPKQQNLFSDVYPLYSELSWNNEEYSSISSYNNSLISGFKITSKNIPDDKYYKFNISFEKYYEDKLSALGWKRDNRYSADGAGSSSWAYTKGSNIIWLSYQSTEINKKYDQLFSCPCDMNFSVFSGIIKNVDNVSVQDEEKKLTSFKYSNKNILYDSSVWGLVENRYCTPAQGQDGKKYDGTPCDLIGFSFVFKNNLIDGSDNIYMGGRQPMSCDVLMGTTKCNDNFALNTKSTKKEVLDFYDYILNVLEK